MQETLHKKIYDILIESSEFFDDYEDVTLKILTIVQGIVGSDIEGYIGDIEIKEATLKAIGDKK